MTEFIILMSKRRAVLFGYIFFGLNDNKYKLSKFLHLDNPTYACPAQKILEPMSTYTQSSVNP